MLLGLRLSGHLLSILYAELILEVQRIDGKAIGDCPNLVTETLVTREVVLTTSRGDYSISL